MGNAHNFGRTAAQQRGPTISFPALAPIAQLAWFDNPRATLLIEPEANFAFDGFNIQRSEIPTISLFDSHGDFAAEKLRVFGFAKFHG